MSACVFCGIVAGSEPAESIYEDDRALGFLSLAQATEGHTLVIPKQHCADLFDIGPERAAEVMRATLKVAALLRSALKPEGMNLFQSNAAIGWQTVFHFHMHVVPRYRVDELTLPWNPAEKLVTRARLTEIAARIRGR